MPENQNCSNYLDYKYLGGGRGRVEGTRNDSLAESTRASLEISVKSDFLNKEFLRMYKNRGTEFNLSCFQKKNQTFA